MDLMTDPMNFLISGTHIPPVYLVAIGFITGILGGFFGVGGSFLAGPALFALGMQMNFVVGTNLAQIMGNSIVGAGRHRVLGNVDYKLAVIMAVGTIPGAEIGAQTIQQLKQIKYIDLVVGISFIVVLLIISAFIGWESWQTVKKVRQSNRPAKKDVSVVGHVSKQVHRFHLPPMVSCLSPALSASHYGLSCS